MKTKDTKNRYGLERGKGPIVGMPTEKAKDFKGTLKRLLVYFKPFKFHLILVLITSILGTGFTVVSPKIMGMITTNLFEVTTRRMQGIPNSNVDFTYISTILFILAILYFSSSAFTYIQQLIMANVSQNTVYKIRQEVNDKLSRLPLKFYDSHNHGEILSRITNDIENISNTMQQSVTQLISSIITLIGIIIIMITINPLMTFILVITLPLYAILTKSITRRSQKYFSQKQKHLGKLNGHIEEMYTGHRIVKAFSREKQSIDCFEEINEELYNVSWKADFISGIIMPLMAFINNIGYVLISIVGGVLAIRGTLKVGDIQAFIQYSRQFTHPIIQTANIANILQSTIASAERVFELLDEVEEVTDSKSNPYFNFSNGEVIFSNVTFGYKEDEPLFENLDLEITSGQTIAIVGPTGAGKTTLVNLLMRFYELDGGKITIDGINISDISRNQLRSAFGMVLQDTWLFKGTIKDNIAYGRDNPLKEEVIQSAKAAHVDHYIRTLPDGYETILEEEASNISTGQKQLITIARAILANPKILILDEATSSVDTRTEVQIQKAMKTLMKGRTNFVIAHRLSTIKHADLILVMNKGKIVEKGNHAQLLSLQGFYYDLYHSQFTTDKPITTGA